MSSVAHRGYLCRTPLAALAAARQALARLRSHPKIAAAELLQSSRAAANQSPACWFVGYLPASPRAIRHRIQQMQTERDARALREGPRYKWAVDAVQGRVFLRVETLSKETYEVTPRSCTCPDYSDNLEPLQGLAAQHLKRPLQCKHIAALPFCWTGELAEYIGLEEEEVAA